MTINNIKIVLDMFYFIFLNGNNDAMDVTALNKITARRIQCD